MDLAKADGVQRVTGQRGVAELFGQPSCLLHQFDALVEPPIAERADGAPRVCPGQLPARRDVVEHTERLIGCRLGLPAAAQAPERGRQEAEVCADLQHVAERAPHVHGGLHGDLGVLPPVEKRILQGDALVQWREDVRPAVAGETQRPSVLGRRLAVCA